MTNLPPPHLPAGFYHPVPHRTDIEGSFEYREERPFWDDTVFDVEVLHETLLKLRGGPRNSDRLLRWDPDQGEGVWNATEETELSG